MRTTITLDEEATAIVQALRRERGVGVSAAVNELVRRGAIDRTPRGRFTPETSVGGALVDLTCTSRALEHAEGPAYR